MAKTLVVQGRLNEGDKVSADDQGEGLVFWGPPFDARLNLYRQSLSLRHVRAEVQVAFGGGGVDHGAVMSLVGSTCALESVEFTGNTQKGVGAGVIFAVGSNVTASFVLFADNRNLGQGAGVIAASAGSRVAVSHSQFTGSYVEKGAMATEGAAMRPVIAVMPSR